MTEVYDFQKKKEEKFTEKMNAKNDAFIKEYRVVGRIYFEFEEKWLGNIGEVSERQNKTYEELFKDEKQFQAFCGELLERLNIKEIQKEDFTFKEYNQIGSVAHKLTSIVFEKKYGNRFD